MLIEGDGEFERCADEESRVDMEGSFVVRAGEAAGADDEAGDVVG